MRIRLLLTLLALFAFASFVSAQDDTTETTPFDDIYSSVPTTRTETGAFVLGDPSAPVTVIEFADYLCPHCQDYHEVAGQFIEEYVLTGQAKFEYRFFVVIDPTLSALGAKVAECAYVQGAFWTAHDVLFALASERRFDANLATTVAEEVGLDADALNACVEGDDPFQYEEDQLFGQDLGVNGTPAVRVQVGDDERGAGYLVVGGVAYNRGGASLEALAAFATSENPSEMVDSVSILSDEYPVDESLINPTETCAPPCWNGITPGETTFDDAVVILDAIGPFAGSVNVQTQDALSLATFGDPVCCQVLSEESDTVTFIQARSAPTLTLLQIIDTYGDPVYLDGATVSRREAVVNIYYPESGFIAFVYVPGEEAPLTDDSPIIGAVYLSDAFFTQILEGSPLHAWEGYLALAEYNAGEFELNPQ